MTISTTSNTVVCQGNGLTTSFDFAFPIPLSSELFVYFTDATGAQTLLSQSVYSVTGIGTANGGSVTYPLSGSPIASGTSLTIQRIVSYQQLTDLVNQSGYYPNVVENALDYLTMQTQQLAASEALSLQVPLSATPPDLLLPAAPQRANSLVGFDANGNATTYPVTASVGAGNMTDNVFNSGAGFTPGVTTTLSLSAAYGQAANVWAYFDGVPQFGFTVVGTAITFPQPIPVGVSQVVVKGGTTLSSGIGIPADGSVTAAKLAPGAVNNAAIAAGAVDDTKLTPTSVAYIITQNRWTLKRFGAKGDGVTDDTAAIQAAFNSGEQLIEGDAGSFQISGPLAVTQNYFSFQGKGQYQTVFNYHDPNTAGITVANGLTGVKLQGFQLIKGLGAVTVGDGIAFLGTSENCEVNDVQVVGFFRGFVLGTTDLGFVRRCIASKNWNAGFDLSNATTYGPVQWQLEELFSAQNNWHGFYVHTNAGVPGLILGAWHDIQTYANSGYGLILNGTSGTPIFDFRLDQFFFGNDAFGSVYANTFGYNNRMENGMIEESSLGFSGPTLSLSAPGTGGGVHVGPSEVDFSIANTQITNSALSGIEVFGGDVNVSNVNINNSGVVTGTGTAGLTVHAGTAIVSGGRMKANPYALLTDGSGVIVAAGSNLNNNTNGATALIAGSKITGCLPLSANN